MVCSKCSLRGNNLHKFFSLQIKLDLPEANEEHYDDSNALVLPSRKRKTKQLQKCEPTVKPLTKKERKTLQKIVATKEKKAKVMLITLYF